MKNWQELLAREVRLLDAQLPGGALVHLCNYLKLLIKWGRQINLVGSTDASAIVSLHLVDCLALLPHLPSGPISLIDVGSGAGLPSIPLAITRPDITVTALEPVHKKHAFLRTARRELALDNFTPLAERLDAHRASRPGQAYDVAVSRAAFPLATWLADGSSLVKSGGLVLGMEGADKVDLPAGAMRHPYEVSLPAKGLVEVHKRAVICFRPSVAS